jgi:hypothetical protein
VDDALIGQFNENWKGAGILSPFVLKGLENLHQNGRGQGSTTLIENFIAN